jgi:hypothetical protein
MSPIVLVIGGGLAVLAILMFVLSRRRTADEADHHPTFVCPECGETHCDCYLEDEVPAGHPNPSTDTEETS